MAEEQVCPVMALRQPAVKAKEEAPAAVDILRDRPHDKPCRLYE